MGVGVITGDKSYFYISAQGKGEGGNHVLYGVSEFSINISRDVQTFELTGEDGDYHTYGTLAIEGSFKMCKFGSSGQADALHSIVEGVPVYLSGGAYSGDTTWLHWVFNNALITGYDVSWGNATTITEASIDWKVMNAGNVSFDLSNALITDA